MSNFVFYMEKTIDPNASQLLIVDSWDTVMDCLNNLTDIPDSLKIYRMKVCSKDD